MSYIYILKSKINSSFYVGSCHDLRKRVKLHNKGLVKSTKRYIPWKVIYIEEYDDYKKARRRELQIKNWKKRAAIEKLIDIKILIEDSRKQMWAHSSVGRAPHLQ